MIVVCNVIAATSGRDFLTAFIVTVVAHVLTLLVVEYVVYFPNLNSRQFWRNVVLPRWSCGLVTSRRDVSSPDDERDERKDQTEEDDVASSEVPRLLASPRKRDSDHDDDDITGGSTSKEEPAAAGHHLPDDYHQEE